MPSDHLSPHRSRLTAIIGGWPTGWRRAVLICLIPVWLLTAFGVAIRWWDGLALVPMLQALFPVFGSVAVILVTLTILTRVGWAICAALAVAAGPIVLSGQALQSETVAATASDEVVLTLNIEYGGADPGTVVDLVRDLDVDTLVLLEITPAGWTRLRAAGLKNLLPHAVGAAEEGAGGSMIRSSHPLTEVAGDDFDELYESFNQPIARVERPDGAYMLRAVHPHPPMPGGTAQWRRQLDHLGRWQAAQPVDSPLVLAGDFNASSAHPAFRQAARGLTDAQAATGAGWVRTWPEGRSLPAFIAIDHILTRNAGVVDAGDAVVPGTDHRAVWARLSIG